MQKPGAPRSRRPRPPGYGAVWREEDRGLQWYEWMYQGRLDQHRLFQRWLESAERARPVESVLELGCGMAVGYAELFASKRYVGADISEQAIRWCRDNRNNPRHDYLACDFIEHRFDESFDVVFSQGTIDNCYDMNAFLEAAARASRRWLYLTAYRGFFPELAEHRYAWHEPHGCFYNDISPLEASEVLHDCRCRDAVVLPSWTGRPDVPFETLIVAAAGHD